MCKKKKSKHLETKASMLIGLAGKRTQHIPSPRMEQHTVKKKNEKMRRGTRVYSFHCPRREQHTQKQEKGEKVKGERSAACVLRAFATTSPYSPLVDERAFRLGGLVSAY
jgi:hypothetical protein